MKAENTTQTTIEAFTNNVVLMTDGGSSEEIIRVTFGGEEFEIPETVPISFYATYFGSVPDSLEVLRVFVYDDVLRFEGTDGSDIIEVGYYTDDSPNSDTLERGWIASRTDASPGDIYADPIGDTLWLAESDSESGSDSGEDDPSLKADGGQRRAEQRLLIPEEDCELITDGGRDVEPEPRWIDWSELQRQRGGSERLVTDGGERIPEKGETAEILFAPVDGVTTTLVGEVAHASYVESRVYDSSDDETGHMEPGISGQIEVERPGDGKVRRVRFNTASRRVVEHHPGKADPEEAIEFLGTLRSISFSGGERDE